MTFFPGVETGTVSTGPTDITYYDSGSSMASAGTIVLLHGTGGSAVNNFWALFPMLAMRYRVVALDFVDPEGDATPAAADYTRQAVSVIKACSDSPVHLVGYSFGAVIAADLATHHAELVESLVLVAGWMKTDAHQSLRNDIWRKLHADSHSALADFTVFTAYSQQFLNSKTPAEIQDLVAAAASGPDRAVKMRFNRHVDISADISEIIAPTLVIGCTHDVMVPIRHSELLFGGIHDCRYAQISSGHAVVHERPSELFTMIDRFVSDPTATAPGTVLENSHA